MKLKSLLTRSISGIIYVGLIIGSIFWGLVPFSCLAAVLGALAVMEFEKICLGYNGKFLLPLILDITGVVCLAFSWLIYPLFCWLCIYICRLVVELYLENPNPIKCLSHSLMTQLYIGIPVASMGIIGNIVGMHFLLAIFLMIWINDTGAYIIGCSIGKNRLFERISPKKSWEGFCGGIIFNLIAAWLFWAGGSHFWQTHWDVITWLIFGVVVSVFATWGDLIESLIKRSLNLKDSGNLIPGHGGILDRIDSILLVMPTVLLFVILYIGWWFNLE